MLSEWQCQGEINQRAIRVIPKRRNRKTHDPSRVQTMRSENQDLQTTWSMAYARNLSTNQRVPSEDLDTHPKGRRVPLPRAVPGNTSSTMQYPRRILMKSMFTVSVLHGLVLVTARTGRKTRAVTAFSFLISPVLH